MRIFLLLVILVALAATAYYGYYRGHEQQIHAAVAHYLPKDRKPITVYRWRGDDGQWNYGPHPPPGKHYEAVKVKPGQNEDLLPPIPDSNK